MQRLNLSIIMVAVPLLNLKANEQTWLCALFLIAETTINKECLFYIYQSQEQISKEDFNNSLLHLSLKSQNCKE